MLASRSRRSSPAELISIIAGYASRRWSRSPVRQDDGASRDFTVVKEVVHLARALQRKLLHQHLDLSGLGQTDDLHELRDRAPVRRGDGAFFRRAVKVHR